MKFHWFPFSSRREMCRTNFWRKKERRRIIIRNGANTMSPQTLLEGHNNKKWYDLKDHNMAPKQWISIRNIINYLETKFRPNWRIFVYWRPFFVQNGHRSKPKWPPHGAACLTPYKYSFPLKSVRFWILNDFFNFYIGGYFENFKNKEHNFEWWSIFVSRFKMICCTVWI